MDKRDYIHLDPPRGRLPWGKSLHRRQLHPLVWIFVAVAWLWLLAWWVMRD